MISSSLPPMNFNTIQKKHPNVVTTWCSGTPCPASFQQGLPRVSVSGKWVGWWMTNVKKSINAINVRLYTKHVYFVDVFSD